ncbi:MAG: hypothetical protein AB1403_08060 [Candidatus Riflebacteria bacterium]
MKRIFLPALVAMALFIYQPALTASPFSEDIVEPMKEKAAEFTKDSGNFVKQKFENLKDKTSRVFSGIAEKINDVARKKLDLSEIVAQKVLIPGHENHNFVCQGIAFLPDKIAADHQEIFDNKTWRYALLSYYPKTEYTDQPSQIVVVDMIRNRPVARFSLFQNQAKPYKGHAGGIAVAGKYLWVASSFKIYAFPLQKIIDLVFTQTKSGKPDKFSPESLQLPAAELVAVSAFPVDSKASYVSFDGKFIWVGDFSRPGSSDYQPVKHHAANPWKKPTWISGYLVDRDGFPISRIKYSFKDGKTSRSAYKPDLVLCCRESVQGMAMFKDHVALSISYGAQNSKLAVYRSPLIEKKNGKTIKIGGKHEIPAYSLGEDEENWLKTIELPAGAEDLEFDGRFLYVTFEGASANYRDRWLKINPRISIEENFYLINSGRLLK